MKKRNIIKKIAVAISAVALLMLMPLRVLVMQIYVEVGDNETVTIECESGDSVGNIKDKIQGKIYFSPECQSLYFNGILLEDQKTLADYNIQKESTLKLVTPGSDIGVYVKFRDNTEWNTVPTDENGKGTVTLPDGTVIEIGGADNSKGTLVIDPITDREVLDWIESVTGDKVKNPQPFHVYYIDSDGNIKEADGVTVKVKPTNVPQNAVVYSLNSDGETTLLEIGLNNGAVTFTANGDSYYVVGEKVGTSNTPGDNAPATGDNSHPTVWFVLLAIGTVLAGTAVYCKKKTRII